MKRNIFAIALMTIIMSIMIHQRVNQGHADMTWIVLYIAITPFFLLSFADIVNKLKNNEKK